MRKIPQVLLQDPLSARAFAASLLLALGSFFVLLAVFFNLPPKVPLFFSLPWGEDQLASPIFLFLIPIGISLALTVNLLIVRFFSEETFLLKILASTSILCSFLGFYGLLRIILLII